MQRSARNAVMDLMTATRTRRADIGARRLAQCWEKSVFADRKREFVMLGGHAETARHSTTSCVEDPKPRAEKSSEKPRT